MTPHQMTPAVYQSPRPRILTRWMIARDVPACVCIDELSFPDAPWNEATFLGAARDRQTICRVAMTCDPLGPWEVVGYSVHTLGPATITLVNLGVHPAYRRQGVGRALLVPILERVDDERSKYRKLVADVWERNLAGLVFLREMGMRWTKTLARLFGVDDGYRMIYRRGASGASGAGNVKEG